MNALCLAKSMMKYIGQTITIFTKSSGISGYGFTGALTYVDENCVRIINSIGATPSCPIHSPCTFKNFCDKYGHSKYSDIYGSKCKNFSSSWVGSVSEIPTYQIASFTHNAI